LYKVVGNSPGSGSNLDDNLDTMLKRGALPLDTPENKARFACTFPHNGFYTKYPTGYLDVCKLFTDAEYLDISSYQEFGTALLKGYPVMYARQSHCITGCRLFYTSGKIMLGYANSWGQWGDKVSKILAYGMGYDSASIMKNAAYGAIALRSANIPPSVWDLSTAT